MRTTTATLLVSAAILVTGVAACSDGGSGELFPIKPECQGEAVTVYAGSNPQVISKLEIGASGDGFDLDRDGDPDNKLASVSTIAAGAISSAINNYEIVIPIEFFDLQGAGKDSCVKFAVYYGAYGGDADGDGERPYVDKGDCNDHNAAIKPGATEMLGNFKDDNCDGRADEPSATMNSTDTLDRDSDGQSMAQGDC